VAVGDGLGADAVADGLDNPLVVLFFCCLAYNVVYLLRQIYCEAKDAVYFWRVPVGCAAEAVCDVMCLPRIPLDVEVVDGEVLPPLLASCIADFLDLFTPDSEERSVIGPYRELLHAEKLPALLDRILDCQRLQLYYSVRFSCQTEAARSAGHQPDPFLPVNYFCVHQRKA
jgi:hypothetical protein